MTPILGQIEIIKMSFCSEESAPSGFFVIAMDDEHSGGWTSRSVQPTRFIEQTREKKKKKDSWTPGSTFDLLRGRA